MWKWGEVAAQQPATEEQECSKARAWIGLGWQHVRGCVASAPRATARHKLAQGSRTATMLPARKAAGNRPSALATLASRGH
eukprot:2556323-Alexandrium_andersonii.AAC.1